ncbi:MAG: SemiSWEET transporter [Saprospiraceae bacterium]|nr:SemiSWEET transporter [Saprospiraceae bacterium]
MIQFIGLFAAVLTTAAFVPQAIKTIRTRSTKDLAVSTYAMLSVGTLLWLSYGLLIKDLPLILANAITASLASTILYFKLIEKS